MIVIYLFQLLLLVPYCLAVPPPVAPAAPAAGKGDPKVSAGDPPRPKVPPINPQFAGGVVVDSTKPSPALLQEIGQAQKEAGMKANLNKLESVSGGGLFWGADTGNSSTGKVEVPVQTTPKATPRSLSTRAVSKKLMTCLEDYNVRKYFFPEMKSFNLYALPYNARNKVIPDMVITAEDVQNVADTVYCAAKNGMSVQARAGGHSYGAFSSGSGQGSIVIDLRYLTDVKYVAKTKSAVVEGGIRLGE
jgi:hypothetical protein